MKKQTHLVPDLKGFLPFRLPFPKGKGPGVRSLAGKHILPLSPVWHAGRQTKSDQRAIHPLSLSERGDMKERSSSANSTKQSQFIEGFTSDSRAGRARRTLTCAYRPSNRNSKKQTHLMLNFKAFSSRMLAQLRSSSSFTISLRAVHEPPLQGIVYKHLNDARRER